MCEIKEYTVEKIAEFARIALSGNDKQDYAKMIQNIFELAEQLASADISSVSQMAHPFQSDVITREDYPQNEPDLVSFQKSAPHFLNGFYQVPAVVDQDTA